MSWFSNNYHFIIVLSLATMLTRFLPFLIPPLTARIKNIQFFKEILPTIMMIFLVIYSYRNMGVDFESGVKVITGIIVVLIHLKFENFILSVLTGTLMAAFLLNY